MDKRKVNNYLQTLHRKLKIEQHESHYKQRVNSDARGGLAVPAPLMNPSCYSSYKPGDKSSMRIGPGSAYDKWNI
jgi:hypothetical protein